MSTSYHHGALPEALLEAAERILLRDGLPALTLRAAAREAGVSHAAPMHHFQDLSGLLSELAAVGFLRFGAAMAKAAAGDPTHRLEAIGRAYVSFATDNPAMFLLMFRSERLDMQRPALRETANAAFAELAAAQGASTDTPTVEQTASMVGAWSLVHGFAMLLIDHRLDALIAGMPTRLNATQLLEAVLAGRKSA